MPEETVTPVAKAMEMYQDVFQYLCKFSIPTSQLKDAVKYFNRLTIGQIVNIPGRTTESNQYWMEVLEATNAL